MKVIFLEDVTNVARAGDTKEVADGYGRNYLLPRKLAVLANSQASAVVEAQLKKLARQRAQTEAEMAEMAGKLNGMEVTLKGKAGAKDRLYGSITSADIADELSRSAGLVVDKRKIELAEPIHKLGSYEVTVRFTHDIAAVLKVTVIGEGGEVGEKKVAEKQEEKVEAKAEAKTEVKADLKAEATGAKAEKKTKIKAEKKTKAKTAKAEGETEEKPEAKKEEKKTKAKAEKKTKVKTEKKAEAESGE